MTLEKEHLSELLTLLEATEFLHKQQGEYNRIEGGGTPAPQSGTSEYAHRGKNWDYVSSTPAPEGAERLTTPLPGGKVWWRLKPTEGEVEATVPQTEAEASERQIPQERVSRGMRTLANLEAMSDEDLAQEAIDVRKTHIANLGMGQSELEGSYLSTEAANRYLKRGHQLHVATTSISNPYIFRKASEYSTFSYQFLPEGKTIDDPDTSPKDIAEAGRKATEYLKSQGYDSAYLPEAERNEGILVVFDRNQVRLGEGQEITSELIASETKIARDATTTEKLTRMLYGDDWEEREKEGKLRPKAVPLTPEEEQRREKKALKQEEEETVDWAKNQPIEAKRLFDEYGLDPDTGAAEILQLVRSHKVDHGDARLMLNLRSDSDKRYQRGRWFADHLGPPKGTSAPIGYIDIDLQSVKNAQAASVLSHGEAYDQLTGEYVVSPEEAASVIPFWNPGDEKSADEALENLPAVEEGKVRLFRGGHDIKVSDEPSGEIDQAEFKVHVRLDDLEYLDDGTVQIPEDILTHTYRNSYGNVVSSKLQFTSFDSAVDESGIEARRKQKGKKTATFGSVKSRYLADKDQLPSTLYHVSPAGPAIESTGALLATTPERDLQGKGLGGPTLGTVSFTGSRQTADMLSREFLRLGDAARTADPASPNPQEFKNLLIRYAEEDEISAGLPKGSISNSEAFRALVQSVDGESPAQFVRTFTGAGSGIQHYWTVRSDVGKGLMREKLGMGDPREPGIPTGESGKRIRAISKLLPSVYPSLEDPVLKSTDWEKTREISPDNVKTFTVSTDSLPDDVVIRRQASLDEIEVFADIPVQATPSLRETVDNDPESKHVMDTLATHGSPYIIGGSVRDSLLGIPSKDIDIEVYGIPEDELSGIVERDLGGKQDQVGKAFGVFKVGNFDIALPRTETATGEKHTDFDVTSDPDLPVQEAARRRDFTINAMMYDYSNDEILDFFDGQKDIASKVIKHVDPKTFVEDPLRVYRAAQFAARFGFTIDPSTQQLAQSMDLSSLPKERVFAEFEKMMLKSPTPSVGLDALDSMGVLSRYFPEVSELKETMQRGDFHAEGDVYTHTKMVMDKASEIIKRFDDDKDKMIIMTACLLHDIGKPAKTTPDGSAIGHEEAGVEPAKAILSRLTDDKEIVDTVLALVENHLRPAQYTRGDGYSDKAYRTLINRHGLKFIDLLAAVSEADVTGRLHRHESGEIEKPDGSEIDTFRARVKEVSEASGIKEGKIAPLISGNDLKDLGFKEGRELGNVLRDIQAKQEEGELTTAEEALDYVRDTFDKSDDSVELFTLLSAVEYLHKQVGGTPEELIGYINPNYKNLPRSEDSNELSEMVQDKDLKKSDDMAELMTLLSAVDYLYKQTGGTPAPKSGTPEYAGRGSNWDYSSSTPPPENAQILTTPSSSTGAPGKQWWRAGQATPQAQETTQAAQEGSIDAHLSKLREIHPNLSETDLQRVASFAAGVAAFTGQTSGEYVEDRVEGITGDIINHTEFITGQNTGIGPAQEQLLDADGIDPEYLTIGDLLVAHEGTPWARAALRSIKIREDLATFLEGKEPEGEPGELFATKKLIPLLREKGAEGIWEYLEGSGLIGSASKPAGAIGSSALNCSPSHDCAKFCYAYKGTGMITTVVVKSELIEWAASNDPERFARQIVQEYQTGKDGKRLYKAGRALRFFDRGEGSEYWAKVINFVNQIPTENGHTVRVHLFSKRPSFLDMVDDQNVRLLSIDPSNPDLARGNDHKIAFVYTGQQDLPILEEFKDRIQVILPVKDAKSGATDEDIEAVRDLGWTKPYVCPIDAGDKVISKSFDPRPKPVEDKKTGEMKQSWTCANCDVGNGIGCYRGQPTDYSTFDPQPVDLSGVSNKELTELTVLKEDTDTFEQFLTTDDVGKMVRGISHIYRRDLPKDEQAKAAEESGVQDGQWKSDNEAKFAESLAEELRKGHEDITKAADTIGDVEWKGSFRKWLRNAYGSVRSGPAGENVNPKLAQILEGGTVAPVQKSDDGLAEAMSLLSAVEYLYKESQWARYEDWTWNLPEDQKDYTVPNGRHVGPKGGRYDVIGYEVDTEGKAIGPGQTTGAGAPREALVPKETSEPVDFVKGPESVMDMTSVEDFASGLPEVSMGDLNAQVRQAYVTGQGSGSISTTPLQPNVAVYSEKENKETGEVERNLSGITTGDGHWFAIGGNTDISVNRNGNGKIQLKYTSSDGSDHTKYSWSWSAHSSRAKFAKVGKLVESGILGDLSKRAISDISNPQPLPDQPKSSGLTIQRNAMSAALVFHTARRPGATSRKSNISVPDGEKLMTSGGKISTAKAVKAVQAVKKEKEGRDVSVVKSDLLAPIMRGEGKDKVLTGFSVRTFGISTLQKRHIVPQSDGSVMLSFIGKSAKVNHAPVTDPALAKKLIEFSKDKNLGDEDYIFSTKAWGGIGTSPVGGTSDYIDSISKGAVPNSKVTARTIRTLQANMVAKDLLASSDIPTTASIGDRNVSSLSAEEFMGSVEAAIATNITSENKKLGDAGLALLSEVETENICRQWIQRRQDSAKLAIAEPASNALGNEPTTCLDNYIDPDLFNEWNEYNQMETEELTSRIMSMDTRKWDSINKKIGDLQKKGWKISPSGVVTYARPKKKKATTKRKKK